MKRSYKNSCVEKETLWSFEEYVNLHSGFSAFKRRIDEQIQLMDLDISLDDEDLLPFYRMGESENFVLGTLGAI